MVLPTEAKDLDRFRMQHRYDTFWCGTLLGGCGKELSDKRYTDRVCHFAHHPPMRCRRVRNGADSADHLFIKRAFDRWLRHQGVQAEAEFRGTPGNGLLGLTYSIPDMGAAIGLQLGRQPSNAWEQRDAILSRDDTHVEWVFGPDTMLARHMTERRGYTLRVACEDHGLSRHVRLGIENAQHAIRWFELSQFRMSVDGIAGPNLEPRRRAPFSPPRTNFRHTVAVRSPEPDGTNDTFEPTYIEVLSKMKRPRKLRRRLNTFHCTCFEAKVFSRNRTRTMSACVAIASSVEVRLGVTYLLLGALLPRRADGGDGGGLEWIVEAKGLERITDLHGDSFACQGKSLSVPPPTLKTSKAAITPFSQKLSGVDLASRIRRAQNQRDHNSVRAMCVSGLLELPQLSEVDRVQARQTIANTWVWLLRQQPHLADVRRNRLLDELRAAKAKSGPDQLLDIVTICQILARRDSNTSVLRWEPTLTSARLRLTAIRVRQRMASVGHAPMNTMSEKYGTQPERLAGILNVVGDSAMVLSYEEDRTFSALSLERLAPVESNRLDRPAGEVIRRCRSFDRGQLSRMVRACAAANELVVVFRADLSVPSFALEAALVSDHAEMVLKSSPEGWIYLTDSEVLIEFWESEEFTAWSMPSTDPQAPGCELPRPLRGGFQTNKP